MPWRIGPTIINLSSTSDLKMMENFMMRKKKKGEEAEEKKQYATGCNRLRFACVLRPYNSLNNSVRMNTRWPRGVHGMFYSAVLYQKAA